MWARFPQLGTRLGRVVMPLEQSIANPILERLLRSRWHWLVSRWCMLITYEGRQTGREFTTPVLYTRHDDAIVVVTSRTATAWWANFRDGHRANLWLAGEQVAVTGEAIVDSDAVDTSRHWLRARGIHWRLVLGVIGRSNTDRPEPLVIVRFRPVA